MKNKIFDSIDIFSTSMSAVEWAWRLLTILVIGGSGTITGFFASESPFFKELGVVAWIAIGLIGAISVSLIFYLIKSSQNQSAMAEYTRAISQPKSRINPLLESFKDQIIPIEELRLPGLQVHENKHFKNCNFVGPAAIAVVGCRFIKTKFIEGGDIIPLPNNTMLTGIIVLQNCTVEDSAFYRITMMVSENDAKNMAANMPDVSIAGL